MGTTVYKGHQRLSFASLRFYQNRLHWVSVGYRENSSPQFAKSTLD